jgi:hypothetical protein
MGEMKLNAILAVAVALALGGIAAGCGDDNNESSTSATAAAAISKADFVAKANQICKQGNAEVDAAGRKLGNSVSQAQLDSFVSDTVIPNVEKQVDGVEALGAPAGEEAQVQDLISVTRADIAELKADPSKIQDDSLFKDSNQKATALGLTECAG